MRLLIACPTCKRQYDASKLDVGQRFRCHCGQVITVQEPPAHNAAVICCSACGAPRGEGALSCSYCGASFTLHERDLDTVCPHCFTRVSHRARYCHYCATPISPESVAGTASKLVCPACKEDHTLTSRAWGNVSVMECRRCAGIWIGNDSFKQIAAKAAIDGMNVENRARPETARPPEVDTPPPDGGTRYRPCAECSQLMVKRNYGRHSGVVIDVCGRHGIWLDADELPRILDWIRAGGLARANEGEAAHIQEDQALRKNSKLDAVLMERIKNIDLTPGKNSSLLGFAVDALVDGLFRFR